ncbi:MAG: sulfurtransferase FdhD, partial [Hadesarchaea archaeon]
MLKIDLSKGERKEVEEEVAEDRPIRLFLNGKPLLTLYATPSHLRELALGYLLGEGFLRGRK